MPATPAEYGLFTDIRRGGLAVTHRPYRLRLAIRNVEPDFYRIGYFLSADLAALPVAGDDDAAKAVVLQLVDELGFHGVDAGSLDESWRQQPGTPVYEKGPAKAHRFSRGIKRASDVGFPLFFCVA